MNRFYCTVCKRVKRVRHLPSNVQDSFSDDPTLRVGQCRRHTSGLRPRGQKPSFNAPVVVPAKSKRSAA